jgi:hypothetical protein
MTKKSIVLISVAVALAACYLYYFTDWINPPVIQILPQLRPPRNLARNPSPVYQVSFNLDGKYRLTSVKVIPIQALETNKNAAPIWNLTTRSNSLPQKGFLYGMPIPGMRPALTNARPARLEPEVAYRLFVKAGRAKGQVDFKTHALPPLDQ